jgi:type VII secretion integral membrane protein EccD
VHPGSTFCRLTVLAPRTRVDAALPTDVPVADLLPLVLELVNELPGDRWRPMPWRLTNAAGRPLPEGATLGELGVPDGELLRLSSASAAPAPPVFDDPIDALAASAGPATGGDRRFVAVALLVVAIGAAAVLASAGPGSWPAAALAGLAAVAAIARAAALVRAGDEVGDDDQPTGRLGLAVTCAVAAVPLAAAAGWTALPSAPGPIPLLLAVGAAGVAAVAGQVVVRVVAPALVGLAVVATFLVAAALGMRFGASPQAAMAAVAGVAVAVGPVLPRAAIRLAGLPRPVIPTGDGDLADADDGPDMLPPEELAERGDLARGYLAGLAGASALVAAAGAVVSATGPGWIGPVFAGVTVAALALRARSFADVVPARTCVVAAVVGGIALAAITARAPRPYATVLAALVLLVVVAVGMLALSRPEGLISPVTRRAVDIVEGLLVAAAIPLALGAMDLYRIMRSL